MSSRVSDSIYRYSRGERVFDVFNYLFLVALAFTFAYPFWETVVLSFCGQAQSMRTGFQFWPVPVALDAYRRILASEFILIGYANTLFRTVVGTGLSLIVTFLGAYALSRKFPLRTAITFFILVPMFFGGGLVARYVNIRQLGLIDSRWVLVLPMLVTSWNLFIARNFVKSIPVELEESARIDGAGPLRIAFRIIAPLSAPVLGVLALWISVRHWNAWFDAMLYINDRTKAVLQLNLRRLYLNAAGGEIGDIIENYDKMDVAPRTLKAAMTVVTIGPIILMYPFVQRYFVKGIMIGSIKG